MKGKKWALQKLYSFNISSILREEPLAYSV